ncbi:putative F-box/FBD/LRR-repeat protein [Cardamine amara subsp. amara]|uniref:F-box/FBD/LRR-repeat protein n=1 Tax=Cardamine amara subsp. amara TaxID=228776 RepID=A0ABD1C6N7_CARAN
MPSEAGTCRKRKRTLLCKDRNSALPDDLLVQILCLVPTTDAVTTMIPSKRWCFVWTMLPRLEYTESYRGEQSNSEKESISQMPPIEKSFSLMPLVKSVWDFLDKSLQLQKAPSLERLRIKLGHQCPVDVDLNI